MEPEPGPEAEQSSEERIKWLRDHGVTVEIPEDRKKQPPAGGAELNKEMVDRAHEKAQAILAEKEAAAPRKKFTYVRIPADDAQPYEVRLDQPPPSMQPRISLCWSTRSRSLYAPGARGGSACHRRPAAQRAEAGFFQRG